MAEGDDLTTSCPEGSFDHTVSEYGLCAFLCGLTVLLPSQHLHSS